MDLRAEILKEHSKAQAQKIAHWIGNNKERFAQLVQLFLHDEYRVVQRSAWVISVVCEQFPNLLLPHLPILVKRMSDADMPVAVKRNVVRALQKTEIPEALHGTVINACFEFLADPKETIAVRAFSMTVLDNLSQFYPDVRQELFTLLEEEMQHQPSAGFRSRAQKILAKKLMKSNHKH